MPLNIQVPATGHNQIYMVSGSISLAQYATYTLTSVQNTSAIVAVNAQRDHNGSINYPSALYYVNYNRAVQLIKSSGGSWDVEDGGSDHVLYASGADCIFKNRAATTTVFSFGVILFGGV